MTELNIKKEIGRRIHEARKDKGLTLKALGELAGDIKQTRLTNWEQGTRAPGPEEIKLLAHALDVSPAFLMCLTDNRQQNLYASPVGALIPVLDHQQAGEPKVWIQAIQDGQSSGAVIPVNYEFAECLGANAFALKMKDDSMDPELKRNDILLIDPDQELSPGGFVVAKLKDNSEVIVRRYRQLSVVNSECELLPVNIAWAGVHIDNQDGSKIIGSVINLIRSLKS